MSMRCYVIGHGQLTVDCCAHLQGRGWQILGVQTSHADVQAWCGRFDIPVWDTDAQLLQAFAQNSAQVLFSIINPRKVATELLALPTVAAINFHDGPLPSYAGLHVTSWAVQNQEASHGVTWHLMSEQFDAGDILIQQRFELEPLETAFTLSLKCYSHGLETFEQLTEQLHQGAWTPTPQADGPAPSRYLGSQRPDAAALLDWQQSAARLDALVRGLTFGTELNPLGVARFAIGEDYYLVSRSRVSDHSGTEQPGVITRFEEAVCEVATGAGALLLEEIRTLDGRLISLDTLQQRHSIRAGQCLPNADADQRAALTARDVRWGRSEAFWRSQLVAAQPLNPFAHLALAADATAEATIQGVRLLVPTQIAEAVDAAFEGIAGDRAARLEALYCCFLSRLTRSREAPAIGSVAVDASALPQHHTALCSPRVPFALTVDHDAPLLNEVTAVADHLASLRQRPGFLMDLVYRTPGCAQPDFPVTLTRGDADSDALPISATGVTFNSGTTVCGFACNERWLSESQLQQHLDLFGAFVQQAASDPRQPLARCGFMDATLRQRVLQTWNQTAAPVATQPCVQQQIEQQAQLRPDATALVYRDQTCSYRALSERAKALAIQFLEAGVQPDTLIGIYLPRSIDMVVAMVAVEYAGAAYVPLDPGYPDARISFMIKDAALAHIVTDGAGSRALGATAARLWRLDLPQPDVVPSGNAAVPVQSSAGDLAYVIYTSGSTGNPKGVMVEHGNLRNFLVAMDQVLAHDGVPGVWLAVTSISFDISVLELFWTLARGFKVVLQEDTLAARHMSRFKHAQRPMDFSLFYFSSDAGPAAAEQQGSRYRLLLEGARFADKHDFSAVWTPERHFHLFGGLYPNPSVTSAAVAAITQRVSIRAGSIVLPLHHPIRVAEEWSVVDNLSNGRVGFSFASGWHANDFALRPENYAERKQLMFDGIETVLSLWRGESQTLINGDGKPFEARVFPPPVQQRPPIWITAAGNVETFAAAGASGHNLLTNLLGQTIDELQAKIGAFQAARRAAGHAGDGCVSVMVHTFIGDDVEAVRQLVKAPFCHYLKTSFDLVKIAPWAFPAFSQPSKKDAQDRSLDTDSFTDEDLDALIEHAFDRYFETAGLFGTPESVLPLVDQLKGAGVTEVACLIDFGVAEESVLANLTNLDALRQAALPSETGQHLAGDTEHAGDEDYSVAAQLQRHGVTHFQCTPSMARLLWAEPSERAAFSGLQRVLLGGEALPPDLAETVAQSGCEQLINVYGPTETTIWSTAAPVSRGQPALSIGRPLANTQIYILDVDGQPLPPGLPGELCIGGAGVVRGYLGRPELTAEKFVADPFAAGDTRLYRTGDLAVWEADGSLRFLGRLDQQIKLRGYRIELGEVEEKINALPTVAECTVVAQGDSAADAQLVAYVVPAGDDANSAAVASWEGRWSQAYARAPADATDTMNTAGWLNSFDGEQHDQAQMQEWVDATCDRILSLQPRRLLEIGCGTGMLLFRLAPHCEHYHGTDVSDVAVAGVKQLLAAQGLHNVSVSCCPADQLPQETQYDTIVLNSVAQYFPSGAYLLDVVRGAVERLAPGGKLFIGDVRSLATLPLFHQTVEWHRSSATDTVGQLRSLVAQRGEREAELVCDPAWFANLGTLCPQLASYSLQLKAGAAHNEMTQFRYDVVLTKAGSAVAPSSAWQTFSAQRQPQLHSSEGLRTELAGIAEPTRITGLRNARLQGAVQLSARLQQASADTTLAALGVDMESATTQGLDPEALESALQSALPGCHLRLRGTDAEQLGTMCLEVLPAGYEVTLFDTPMLSGPSSVDGLEGYCNAPAQIDAAGAFKELVQQQLARSLPDFMVPSAVMLIDVLPLTPNGKIDRKRLPQPEQVPMSQAPAFVAPSNLLEQQIAEVFCAMLNRESIGVNDNFFDLGANSLLVVQANSRLSKLLGRKVPLVSMYRYPTIAALAQQLGDNASDLPAPKPTKALDRAQRRKQARAGRRRRSVGGSD